MIIPLLAMAMTTACDSGMAAKYRDSAVEAYGAGRLKAAVTEMEKAVGSCGSEPQLRFMLGNAYYRVGRINDADREYAQFVASRPDHFDGQLSAGFTKFELRDFNCAVERFLAATRIERSVATARLALAAALRAAGDMDNAIIQYDHAVSLDAAVGDPSGWTDIRWKDSIRKALAAVVRASSRAQASN